MTEINDLADLRARRPAAIEEAFAQRTRRSEFLPDDGKLFIVAADHPARGAIAVGSRPTAMADRHDLLARLTVALSDSRVDGVLGTPDILDDLALLGLLEGRIAVGSMNRGGLRGATFEMDDRFTGHDVPAMVSQGLDAAKLLVRINYKDVATASILEATANAVNEAARARLPIVLEPFISKWTNGRIVNDLSTDAVITSIAITSALGPTSAYSWLKIPVVPEMERVMAATTLPTLLLGGDTDGDPHAALAKWERALTLPGVRGMVVGRTMLYPENDDVAAAVDTAARLVHTS